MGLPTPARNTSHPAVHHTTHYVALYCTTLCPRTTRTGPSPPSGRPTTSLCLPGPIHQPQLPSHFCYISSNKKGKSSLSPPTLTTALISFYSSTTLDKRHARHLWTLFLFLLRNHPLRRTFFASPPLVLLLHLFASLAIHPTSSRQTLLPTLPHTFPETTILYSIQKQSAPPFLRLNTTTTNLFAPPATPKYYQTTSLATTISALSRLCRAGAAVIVDDMILQH